MTKKIILTSGIPGAGKSFLAESLARENNGQICTTDDFFMKEGKYQYDVKFIGVAHKWNFGQFCHHIFNGCTYIIVANTNLKTWEMMPYVEFGAKMGFDFEIVEPKTKWRYDVQECFKRNTHNVPLYVIERMLKERENPKDMEKELRAKFYK